MNQYRSWLDNSKSIHSVIKENALRNPNSIALIEGENKLTYGELDYITDSMAYDLVYSYVVHEN